MTIYDFREIQKAMMKDIELTKTILPTSEHPELWVSDMRVKKLRHGKYGGWRKKFIYSLAPTKKDYKAFAFVLGLLMAIAVFSLWLLYKL